jgi:hypothetical protein
MLTDIEGSVVGEQFGLGHSDLKLWFGGRDVPHRQDRPSCLVLCLTSVAFVPSSSAAARTTSLFS